MRHQLTRNSSSLGKWIATGCGDHKVRIYEAATGRLAFTFAGHEAPVMHVEFFKADGGNLVTSIDSRGNIKKWELAEESAFTFLDAVARLHERKPSNLPEDATAALSVKQIDAPHRLLSATQTAAAARAKMRQGSSMALTALQEQRRAAAPAVTLTATGVGKVVGRYTVYESAPFEHLKSTFTAYAARLDALDDEPALLAALRPLQPPHTVHLNMRALRVRPPGADKVTEDYNDDGEKGMGEKLAFLLRVRDLENVIVVVSRVMRGGLIGGKRFKLGAESAGDALDRMVLDEAALAAAAPKRGKAKHKKR